MKFGVELEGFVYQQDCGYFRPVDVYHWLDQDGQMHIPELGICSTDAGINQIEWSLDPIEYLNDLENKLRVVMSLLPQEWQVFFCGEDPHLNGVQPIWAPKSRYKALVEALKNECPKTYYGVLRIPQYSATHIHLELHPDSQEGLKVLNYLNNWAPLIGTLFANPLPSRRIKEAWRGWADPRRLPGPWWFNTTGELREFVLAIPKLIIDYANGTRPYLGYTSIPDQLHEGTIWWWCRPRWTLGTVEFRVLDSMPPDRVLWAVSFILDLVEIILNKDNLPVIHESTWWLLSSHQDIVAARQFFERYVSFLNLRR